MSTMMIGVGKLEGLPALKPHQEAPLFQAIVLARLPEKGAICPSDWSRLVFADLALLEESSGSYHHYHMMKDKDFDSLKEDLLERRYVVEQDSGEALVRYLRGKKVDTFFKRLNPGAKEWVARLRELTLLETLAGL